MQVTDIINGLLLAVVAFFVLYGEYLAYLTLKRAKDRGELGKLGRLAKVMAYLHYWIGATLDIAFNATLFTLLFLEPPVTWTITARCQRHYTEDGWRGDLARWICRRLLDPLQDGGHC